MPSRTRTRRIVWLALAAAIGLFAGTALVWSFAEETIYFRDPYTHETTDELISTLHDDLTYVRALAAGFSIADARSLQLYDQLVDSEQLGPGTAVSYTNCTGGFYPTPAPGDVCAPGTGHPPVAWPMWDQMLDPATCATSRFGPYSPFFHFPHQNARDLGALHDWGWGLTSTLVGYEAYAWGGLTVLAASCRYTRTAAIDTGMVAGSLPAFATYLHGLADSYSHRDCIAALDALGLEWPVHTTITVSACLYHPESPDDWDVHGREFYTHSLTDSLRTDLAVRHVYTEMVARSLQREGEYFPLDLDTPLPGIAGSPTLSETFYAFVHNWWWSEGEYRRADADTLAAAILAQRKPVQRLYLPAVAR